MKIGGLKGIQTLTRSLQDFYALRLHHQPENKIGVEGGIFTRTSLVLTRQGLTLCVSSFRHFDVKNKNTDGEI